VIPKTTTYKQFKENKAKDAAKHTEMEKGQRTLNGSSSVPSNGASAESTLPQPEVAISSPSVPRTPVVPVSALIADRTVDHSARNDPDIEMKD
jgi:DNA-directed RNA polymerase I subunit RPA43